MIMKKNIMTYHARMAFSCLLLMLMAVPLQLRADDMKEAKNFWMNSHSNYMTFTVLVTDLHAVNTWAKDGYIKAYDNPNRSGTPITLLRVYTKDMDNDEEPLWEVFAKNMVRGSKAFMQNTVPMGDADPQGALKLDETTFYVNKGSGANDTYVIIDYYYSPELAGKTWYFYYEYEHNSSGHKVMSLGSNYCSETVDCSHFDAMDYSLKRTELKDSLIGYQQAMQLSKAEFESELSDMELQLAQLNHRHQMMLVTSILCGIIALLVLGLGYFIHRRNRQLSARNQALYDKNQQLIAANKHERMTREQLEELLEQTRREQAEALAAVSQQELVDNDDTEEPVQPKGEPVKYKDSRLTELDKNRLQGLIQKVLDTPDVICDPDFTVMQLAALIGARQREVSQVIGERYGANFNIVVNDHRVKEACRRIQDEPRFLQNTIEAMAGEVGIRSRNTFTQAFKRVTGMNPSEYIRRARTR